MNCCTDMKKVLLLIPSMFTIADTLKQGFEQNDCKCMNYDIGREITALQRKIHSHVGKLPFIIRKKWYSFFVDRINARQLEQFKAYEPDLVIVYNGMFLYPETVREMQKTAKVSFLLGDSPFYTPQNDFFLPSLMQVDYILCPDSYWEKQFRGMGHAGALYFQIATNPATHYIKDVTAEEKQQWSSDLIFVGATYLTATGYKRARFLDQFSQLDIKIYTSKGFRRWYRYFPELEPRVVPVEKRISEADLNTMLNCCKIYPVDANPGLLNGIHLRIFDCIASGILPLAEYRKDVKTIFGPVGLPIIADYRKAAAQAEYYLQHENERNEIISALRKFTDKNFSPQIAVAKLLEAIKP